MTKFITYALISLTFSWDAFAISKEEMISEFRKFGTSVVHAVHPEFKIFEDALSSITHGKRIYSQKIRHSYSGIPFCNFELRLVFLKSSETQFEPLGALGLIPPISQEQNLDILENQEPNTIKNILRDEGLCLYFNEKKQVLKVRDLVVDIQGLSYRALVFGNQKVKVTPLFFDLKAQVQAYNKNPIDGELTIFETEILEGENLSSEHFETQTRSVDKDAPERAESETAEFVYDPSDNRFPEASAFIYATNMYDYFVSIGYKWEGDSPLTLNIHAPVSGNRNNALYSPAPANKNNRPSISLGDGDGKILRNLAVDADVISHEFGHHVVYRTLKDTSGEALILHEGLADFFAFARTDDACLGESICPEASTSCQVQGMCLRSGENDLNFQSEEFLKLLPHQKGQIISGLLWDLKEEIPLSELAPLVQKSVDFLVRNSGFRDFFVSVLLSDLERNEGKNACKILEVGSERGFSEFLSEIVCEDSKTWVKPSYEANIKKLDPPSEDPPKKKSKSLFGCARVGTAQQSDDFDLLLVLLLIILMMLKFKRRIISIKDRL